MTDPTLTVSEFCRAYALPIGQIYALIREGTFQADDRGQIKVSDAQRWHSSLSPDQLKNKRLRRPMSTDEVVRYAKTWRDRQ